jgi:hypothetical protein
MLLIASSVTLLAIFAGVKLLIQTQKENLSTLYKCVSWFIIIMGFLILTCVMCQSVIRYHRMGEARMENKIRMMGSCHDNNMSTMRGGHSGYCMMGCGPQRKMMEGCCSKMMMGTGCCDEEKESCKNECEGMSEKKHHGYCQCNDKQDNESEEYSMNKHCSGKKDSIKTHMYIHKK